MQEDLSCNFPQIRPPFPGHEHLKCPRCDSMNTKFCYYNNYNLSQPRHFCKNCRRYWTKGGTLRNIPVGGGTRKNHVKRPSNKKNSSSSSSSSIVPTLSSPSPPPCPSSSSSSLGDEMETTLGFGPLLPSDFQFGKYLMSGLSSNGAVEDHDMEMKLDESIEMRNLEEEELNLVGGGGGGGRNISGDGELSGTWPELGIYTSAGATYL